MKPARLRTALLIALALLTLGTAGSDPLANADHAWQRRAVGETAGRPLPAPVLESIRAYERVLDADPGALEARWKLLRSLHFAAEFAVFAEQEQQRFLERGREVAETGLGLVAAASPSGERLDALGPRALPDALAAVGLPKSDVARLHFWAAIHWGAWSREAGLLAAVRAGVANRIHRYTQIAIALDPEYDDGAAYRLLGRLHAELPRVPFVSGWVDREQAIPLIERAFTLAPENPGNRLLLALTLLELDPARRPEALALLQSVERLTPRDTMKIEDLAMRREAADRLLAVRG